MFTNLQRKLLELMTASGKSIKPTELVEAIMGIRGAKFIGLVSVTDPDMRKTGNPYFGKVVKIARINGQINFDYENAVNNQREREGTTPDFNAGTAWHEPVKRKDGTYTPFARHKDKGTLYLRVRPLGVSEVSYMNRETGELVSVDVLRPYMPERKPSTHQDTEKEILFRLYALDSVASVTVDGETLMVS